jgi:hypothetical protein
MGRCLARCVIAHIEAPAALAGPPGMRSNTAVPQKIELCQTLQLLTGSSQLACGGGVTHVEVRQDSRLGTAQLPVVSEHARGRSCLLATRALSRFLQRCTQTSACACMWDQRQPKHLRAGRA